VESRPNFQIIYTLGIIFHLLIPSIDAKIIPSVVMIDSVQDTLSHTEKIVFSLAWKTESPDTHKRKHILGIKVRNCSTHIFFKDSLFLNFECAGKNHTILQTSNDRLDIRSPFFFFLSLYLFFCSTRISTIPAPLLHNFENIWGQLTFSISSPAEIKGGS